MKNELDYGEVVRRIGWIILGLGLAGAIGVAIARGLKDGASFLLGAAISYTSFRGWRHLVDVIVPNPEKRRSTAFFVIRLLLLVAAAWVIIKFLGLNVAAAALGLLVSGAAVILEIIYELIYAS